MKKIILLLAILSAALSSCVHKEWFQTRQEARQVRYENRAYHQRWHNTGDSGIRGAGLSH